MVELNPSTDGANYYWSPGYPVVRAVWQGRAMSKSIFQSKTFWFNAVALVALTAQWALGHHWIQPTDSAFVIGATNIWLRTITSQPVTLPGQSNGA